MTSKRNLSIDLIKLLAMVMVVMLHLNSYFNRPDFTTVRLISRACGIAIPLFFMVSGYLMAGKEASFRYSLTKALNIVKVTLIVCLVYDIYSYVRFKVMDPSFPDCLFYKSEWWHFWYFGSMIIIYLMLPLLAKVINGKYLKTALLSLLGFSLVTWIMNIGFQFEEKYIYCLTLKLWYYVFYFLLGAYIRKNNVTISIQWYQLLLIMALYVASVILLPLDGVEYHFGSPLCVLYASAFFLFILNSQVKSPIVSALTPAILPAYLFHTIIIRQFIVKLVCPFVERYVTNLWVADLIEIPIAVIAVLLTAKAFTYIPKYSKIFKL